MTPAPDSPLPPEAVAQGAKQDRRLNILQPLTTALMIVTVVVAFIIMFTTFTTDDRTKADRCRVLYEIERNEADGERNVAETNLNVGLAILASDALNQDEEAVAQDREMVAQQAAVARDTNERFFRAQEVYKAQVRLPQDELLEQCEKDFP